MFIYCMDKELKHSLINNGFKLLKDEEDKAVFLFAKNIKFDFDKVDKSKFIFTNRLTF